MERKAAPAFGSPTRTSPNSVAVLKYGLGITNFGPCQSTPFVTGSLASGNLTLNCLMWQYFPGGYNYILQYPIGSGPLPWTAAPTILGGNAGNSNTSGVTEDALSGARREISSLLNTV